MEDWQEILALLLERTQRATTLWSYKPRKNSNAIHKRYYGWTKAEIMVLEGHSHALSRPSTMSEAER